MKVLFCAGGTGGGIYPGLAAASELRALGLESLQMIWIGTPGEMEETLVPREGITLETIPGGPIVGVPYHVMLRNGVKATRGLIRAMRLLRRIEPDVVFMTGGYVAVPVTLAAWLTRIPICVFLPDVEPGAGIKLGVRFARKIACTTEASRAYAPPEKMVVTGYPVRAKLRDAVHLDKREALGHFGLKSGRPTLFVFGGSRGARSINRALMAILPELLSNVQVIHISGTLTWPEVKANAEGLAEDVRAYYRPYPYLHDEMGAAFRAADLVVARAGASMLGECPAFGVPSVLVPYPHAWRYQKVNADFLSERGAAEQLADDELAAGLLPAVRNLLRDMEKLAAMSAAAKALDKPDATEQLARLIMSVGMREQGGIA